MRRTWSHVSLAVLLAVAADRSQAIEHLGFTKEDGFAECAGRVLGKPVLVSESWWSGDTVPCPVSREAFVESLAARQLTVVDCGQWLHLFPVSLYHEPSTQPQLLWKQLRVALKVDEWGSRGSSKLSPTERDQIAKVIVEQARPPVVYTPRGYVAGTNKTKVEDAIRLELLLDARTLGKGRKESVIGVWGYHLCRVVYGEMDNGIYRPLWDSPHFNADFIKMGHLDVDGDGVEEIVLEARNGRDGLEWVIFNVKGEEISRQTSCESQKLDRGSVSPGITCPISGKRDPGIKWEQRPNGKWDLVVEDWDGRHWGPMRYRLVNGRYVLQTARRPARKSQPN